MTDMSERQALASLFRKKAAVMQALEGGMAKGGKNDHFNYKFVTASAIKAVVSHLLAEHGLSLKMSGIATENAVSRVANRDGTVKEVPILRVQFVITLCDVDTGAIDESFWFGEAGATDDKAASKAATSALKYYLISNLLIADKEEDGRDTDLDADKKRREPNETPRKQGKPAPQAPAPHWSTDPRLIDAMAKWAMDTHKASRDDVNAAIVASGKPITALERVDVKTLVTAHMQKKGMPS